MTIDDRVVINIARLARIQLTAENIPDYAKALTRIIELVDQMNSAPTEDIEPMAHPHAMNAVLRDDVVTEDNQRDNYQNVAPQTDSGLYLVPKVLD